MFILGDLFVNINGNCMTGLDYKNYNETTRLSKSTADDKTCQSCLNSSCWLHYT